ncbi:MAG: hypothetical protein ACXWPM_00335 [Bdellovibrionota bacterium]
MHLSRWQTKLLTVLLLASLTVGIAILAHGCGAGGGSLTIQMKRI